MQCSGSDLVSATSTLKFVPMDRVQSLRSSAKLNSNLFSEVSVRCSTLKSSIAEDLEKFFPAIDNVFDDPVHDDLNDDVLGDLVNSMKIESIQKMLTCERNNSSVDVTKSWNLSREENDRSVSKVEEDDTIPFNHGSGSKQEAYCDKTQSQNEGEETTIPYDFNNCDVTKLSHNDDLEETVIYKKRRRSTSFIENPAKKLKF